MRKINCRIINEKETVCDDVPFKVLLIVNDAKIRINLNDAIYSWLRSYKTANIMPQNCYRHKHSLWTVV